MAFFGEGPQLTIDDSFSLKEVWSEEKISSKKLVYILLWLYPHNDLITYKNEMQSSTAIYY